MEESGKTPFLPVSSECPEETYFFRKKPNPDIICINLNNLFFTFPDIGGGGKMEADARHDFTATADDELSFCKGDVLKVSGEGQTLGRHGDLVHAKTAGWFHFSLRLWHTGQHIKPVRAGMIPWLILMAIILHH